MGKQLYRFTDAAGPWVAGYRRDPASATISLTPEEAELDLLLGTLVPDGPDAPSVPVPGAVAATDRVIAARGAREHDFTVDELTTFLGRSGLVDGLHAAVGGGAAAGRDTLATLSAALDVAVVLLRAMIAARAADTAAALGAKAEAGTNRSITSLAGLTTPLSVAQGGTGTRTPAAARGALGLPLVPGDDGFEAAVEAAYDAWMGGLPVWTGDGPIPVPAGRYFRQGAGGPALKAQSRRSRMCRLVRALAVILALAPALALAQGAAPLVPVPNRAANDNSSAPANTRYVDTATRTLLDALATKAPLGSPTFGGTVSAPALNVSGPVSAGTFTGAGDSMTVPPRLAGGIRRTLAARLRDLPVTPLDQGAQCGGLVDATAALSALSAAGIPITLPDTCILRVGASLTLAVPVTGRAGGVLKVDAGVTLTLAKGYSGPLSQAFDTSAGGAVRFAAGTQETAYPEWWGVDGSGWSNALDAVVGSGTARAQLQRTDYITTRTWKILAPYVEVAGLSRWPNATPQDATRIVLTSGTADVIQLGPDTAPARGVNFYQKGNKLHGITATRSIVPAGALGAAYGTKRICTGPVGIRAQYLSDADIYNTMSAENSIGYAPLGTVWTRMRNNFAFRSGVGSNATSSDCFTGYALDGRVPILAGGNASLYFRENNTTVGGKPPLAQAIATHAYGAYVDTFVLGGETAGVATGFWATGTNGAETAPPFSDAYKAANVDLHVEGLIIDQYTDVGIGFEGMNPFGAARLNASYVGAARTATGPAYLVQNSAGAITVSGNQAIMISNRDAGSSAVGFLALNASGIASFGNAIVGAARPVVLTNVRNGWFADTIRNPVGASASQAAVLVTGSSSRNRIEPNISGGPGVFPQCVSLPDAASTDNAVDVTATDPASCGTRLGYIASAITAPGIFGTGNDARGLSGAWATYTPTASASNATTQPSFSALTGSYNQQGRTVTATMTATVGNAGTGASGYIIMSLPVPALYPQPIVIGGRENGSSGRGLTGKLLNATTILVQFADGSYPGAAGYELSLGVSYQAQ